MTTVFQPIVFHESDLRNKLLLDLMLFLYNNRTYHMTAEPAEWVSGTPVFMTIICKDGTSVHLGAVLVGMASSLPVWAGTVSWTSEEQFVELLESYGIVL